MQRNTQQSQKQPPNPNRFKDFTLNEDESGFTINGSTYVFYFDKRGGWFDEYDNYYNADGNPDRPPSDEGEDDVDDFEDYDRLAAEYDDGDDDYDDHVDNYDDMFRLAENKKKIAQYLPDHDIDVEIENINFKVSEDAFKKEFLQRHGIKETKLEFYYDQNRGNRFTGTCLVTLDLANCSKLIEFDGEQKKYAGRDLRIFVLKPPVEEEAEEEEVTDVPLVGVIKSEPTPLTTSSTIWRNDAKKEEPKPQEQPVKEQPKEQPKQQSQPQPITQQKSEETKNEGGRKGFTNNKKDQKPDDKKVQNETQVQQQKPQQQTQQKPTPVQQTQQTQPQKQQANDVKPVEKQTSPQKSKPDESSNIKDFDKPKASTNVETSKSTQQSKETEKSEPKKEPNVISDPNAFNNGWAQLKPRKKKN